MKRLFVALSALTFLVGLVLPWVADPLIRGALVDGLEEAGFEEAYVSSVDVDWVSGRVDIRGLEAWHGGQRVLSLQTISADWRWQSVFGGRMRQLAADGGVIHLAHSDGHWTLPGINTSTEPNDEPVGLPLKAIERLELNELRIVVSGVQEPQTIQLRDVRLGSLDLDTGQRQTPFTLSVEAAGGQLDAIGSIAGLPHAPVVKSDLTLSSINLKRLSGLSPAPLPMDIVGTIHAQHRMAWDGVALSLDGSTVVDAAAFYDKTLEAHAKSLEWTGRLLIATDGGESSFDGGLNAREPYVLLSKKQTLRLASVSGEVRGGFSKGYSVAGQLEGKQLRFLEVREKDVAADSFRWEGSLASPDAAIGPLTMDGELTIAGLGGRIGEVLQIDNSAATWSGTVTQGKDATKLAGRLTLNGVDIRERERTTRFARFDWTGDARINSAEELRLMSEGLSLSGISLKEVPNGIHWNQDELSWAGDLALSKGSLAELNGNLSLKGTLAERDSQALSLASASLQGLRAASDRRFELQTLALSDIAIESVSLPADEQKEPPLLTIKEASIQGVEVDVPAAASVERIDIKDQRIHLVRSPDGALRLPVPSGVQAEPSTATVHEESEAFSWEVGAIGLSGDNQVLFEDRSLQPTKTLSLNAIQLSLGALSSARAGQATPLNLEAKVGETGEVTLEGTVTPLADKPAIALDGAFRHLDMLSVSEYLEEALGHRVTAGNLDADSRFEISEGRITSTNALVLHQFEVTAQSLKDAAPAESAEPKQTKEGEEKAQASLPLELALALLKDSNNQIKLDLPVEGDMNDPKFDPSDAIGQAVGSAVTTGALLFLQPFGTLAIAGKLALTQASLVQFDPALFEPGQSALDSAQKTYLDALADKLKARPGLKIKVCAVVPRSDLSAMKPEPVSAEVLARAKAEGKPAPAPVVSTAALNTLAGQRDKAVRDYLTGGRGVAVGQLVSCAPRVEREGEGKPRVELGM